MALPDANLVTENSGGQAQLDVFVGRYNDDKTAFQILDPTNIITSPTFPESPDLPVVGSPTRANALYSLTLIADAGVEPQEDGTLNYTPDNFEDTPALNDSLLKMAIPLLKGSSKLAAYKLENGIERGGGITAGKPILLVIDYGCLDTITGKVKTHMSLNIAKPTSGKASQKADEYSKPVVQLDGILPECDTDIAAAMFDSRFVTAAGRKIYKQNGFERQYLPKGSAL